MKNLEITKKNFTIKHLKIKCKKLTKISMYQILVKKLKLC